MQGSRTYIPGSTTSADTARHNFKPHFSHVAPCPFTGGVVSLRFLAELYHLTLERERCGQLGGCRIFRGVYVRRQVGKGTLGPVVSFLASSLCKLFK